MPRLVIVIGANGAGKSTWCHHHRRELPACFYDADSIAQGLGSYDDAAHQREARAWVDRRIEEHLAAGESFGFESTYSGASRPNFVRRAHDLGYDVQAIFIGTGDVSINIDRVAMRVRQRTGHDVPVGEITRRWSACQENLVQTANLFGGIRLIDNTTHVSVTVAQLSGRSIVQATELRPPWAAQLAAAIQRGQWTAGRGGLER